MTIILTYKRNILNVTKCPQWKKSMCVTVRNLEADTAAMSQ